MGHANYENISRRVNSLLHKGEFTIKSAVAHLKEANQSVHASEGKLDGNDQVAYLAMATQEIVQRFYSCGLIEPYDMSKAQQKVFKEWEDERDSDWDSGSDGTGGQYAVFDSIKWRPLKKRLPMVREVSH